ncbi:MAG: HEAT repeat domain-containing protein [Planctomycetes bacterium]|nr:HEAT repeat domain-containing protein [Planctomycetota bacterium]
MLDDALAALKEYDWGTELAPLAPLEDALAAAHGNAAATRALEAKLVEVLTSDVSRDAKDYICRKLTVIGSAASVPALAALVVKPDHAHMARFALEQSSAPEAAQALRDAAGKTSGGVRVGIVGSLGARQDAAAVGLLKGLLGDSDAATARAAALALGAIGTAEAAAALQAVAKSAGSNQTNVVDALLHCAESLLAGKNSSAALAIYQALAGDGQARLTRLAATRGILACSSQQA